MTRDIAWLAILFVTPWSLGADRPEFQPRRVVKPFPTIEAAAAISGAKVKDEVRPNELVLGVTVNGESRAYPINQLTRPTREIINDRLGGSAIAATW